MKVNTKKTCLFLKDLQPLIKIEKIALTNLRFFYHTHTTIFPDVDALMKQESFKYMKNYLCVKPMQIK